MTVPVLGDLEAELVEDVALLLRLDLEADHGVGALGAEADDWAAPAAAAIASPSPDPARARVLDDQLGRELRSRPREVRIDALLPAVRALGAQTQPLGAAQDADGLEVRRLEQDARRRLGDLGLLAAHDPGESDRPLAVGDQQVGWIELALDAVERPDLLPLARAADEDAAAGAACRRRTRAAGSRARA